MCATSSAHAARGVIDTLIMGFVRDLLTLVGLVVVMIYQQPTLSLFALVFGPLAILGARQILQRVQGIVEANMISAAEIIKVIQETSTGIRVVKAFAIASVVALSTVSIFGDAATSLGELMSFVAALLMAYDPANMTRPSGWLVCVLALRRVLLV